jgi:hypothetical protein
VFFYAVTPAYPHEKAFRDPTHVNVLAAKVASVLHDAPSLGQHVWLFRRVSAIRQNRVNPRGDYEPRHPGPARHLRRLLDGMLGQRSHLVWEMQAVKPAMHSPV